MATATFPDLSRIPPIDTVGVEERIDRLTKRSIKKESKVFALKLALSMIDLTTLEGADTPGKVRQLCYKAKHLHDAMEGLPHVGAVCVYPELVAIAKKELAGTNIKVAAVASGFPSGQYPMDIRLEDTRRAVEAGADEIDMVISRGHFLAGDYQYVFDEVAQIKVASGTAHLKVILETGELSTLDNVRKASEIAMHAGGDFIKTSTGKVVPASTLPVFIVMLEAIRDFYYATGKKIGMKPAGGIATAKIAIQYLVVLRETLGEAWMNNELFRIGASRLANDILMQLVKEKTGVYQSLEYFSKD